MKITSCSVLSFLRLYLDYAKFCNTEIYRNLENVDPFEFELFICQKKRNYFSLIRVYFTDWVLLTYSTHIAICFIIFFQKDHTSMFFQYLYFDICTWFIACLQFSVLCHYIKENNFLFSFRNKLNNLFFHLRFVSNLRI